MNFTYISKHFIHSQWKALQSYGPYPCEFLTSQTQLFSNESSRCLSVYTTGWEITDMWLAMKDYGSISAKYETIPFGIKKKTARFLWGGINTGLWYFKTPKLLLLPQGLWYFNELWNITPGIYSNRNTETKQFPMTNCKLHLTNTK